MGDAYKGCPSIYDFIDVNWKPEEKNALLEYLSQSASLACTSKIMFPCLIADDDDSDSLCERTDGIWLWLDDLPHYIIHHDLRLPDSFVKHILERGSLSKIHEITTHSFQSEKLERPPTDLFNHENLQPQLKPGIDSLRHEAEEAFRDMNYAKSYLIYKQIGNQMTPAERRRYSYCEKHSGLI